MPTIFIHAGAGKTGTSYLQVLFARYKEMLAENGVLYPDDASLSIARRGAVTSGNGVKMANYLRPNLPHVIEDKDAFLGELVQTLDAADGKNVLYSSEFINFPVGERSRALTEAISRACYTPRVIFLVRDLGSAAQSVYSQAIKRAGETRPFSEFIKTWDPNYKSHVENYVREFGKANVAVFNYEIEKRTLADLFFRRILNMNFVPDDDINVNRSLTPKEIELLRLMNTQFPEAKRGRLSTFVSDALIQVRKPDQAFTLTKDEFEFLDLKFGSSLSFLNDLIVGPGIKIADNLSESRDDVLVDDFETSVVTILAKLIQRSLN
jgi:hypothetical protein